MRVVADANVLVSAALGRSPKAPSVMALDAALDGRVELVTSPKLLAEVADVLGRPRLRRYLSTEEATRYVDDLAALTVRLNDPVEPHAAVCRDPRDDYLVALARSSGADAVVTGDLDLLAIDPNELEIEILTPRLLVERLAAS
ncbi:MAG: putative toxin-antitoxin system toxin component, PIN family [Solirubrobacteraceae bacterium]|jgi:putative PIN family toxin of toxin-antitoxin system